MNLNLFVDIQNRQLVSGIQNATPVTLDGFIKEDSVTVLTKLLMPNGNISNPFDLVDISSLTMKMGLGERDGTLNAVQDTWTKDTTAGVMSFSGNLVINTTEINDLLAATSADTIEQWLEIEIQDSGAIHTALQYKVQITKDVIRNGHLDPEDVEAPSELATSMADILTDGVTTQWTKSGDDITAHIKGLSGLSNLTGDSGKVVTVKSAEDGFELSAASGSGATTLDELTDTDGTPSDGDHLVYDSDDSKWKPATTVPTHNHSLDSLNDVNADSPNSDQILKYSDAAGEWVVSNEGASQNLYETVEGDSGSTTANSATDSIKIAGGEGVNTSVSDDEITISAEQASDTNKGVATFNTDNFTVDTDGDVTLKNIPISDGGTGQSEKESAFDALAPTTSAGDIITHTGSDNERLAKGTAGQVLSVNAGATELEWADQTGGTAQDVFKTVSVSGQDDVVAESGTDTLNLAAGSNVTLTTDASTDTVTIASSGGGSDVFKTISISGEDDVVADSATDTLTLVAGSNVTMSTDASTDTITINSTASGGGGSGTEISFDAHRDNDSDFNVPPATPYGVTGPFDTTTYNVGSCYDTSTYKFTPTSAGKYLLRAAVQWESGMAEEEARITIRKNGVIISQDGYGHGSATANMHTAVLVDANGSSDYFDVYLEHGDSVNRTVNGGSMRSYFQGILVGGTSTSNSWDRINIDGTQADLVADDPNDTLTFIAGDNMTITTSASADRLTFDAATGGDSFKTISVSGQDDVVADSSTDTLTLVAGDNLTITTDDSTDSITFDTHHQGWTQVHVAGQDSLVSESNNDGFYMVAGSGITLTTNNTTDSVTITGSGGSSGAVTTVTDADSVALDFDDDELQILNSDRSGSNDTIAFTTSNRAIGKKIMLRLKNTATYNSLEVTTAAWIDYPSSANFFEGGSELNPDANILLRLTCWGTAETDITAEWIDESQI